MGDIPPFYEKLIRKIKAPLMIDTTDPKAVELALTYCQGKSIINSINLEDGEEKFERICPLARRYGAALIVGSIDEDKQQAQAFTRERKLAVAERSVKLLTEKYGIPAEDIIIDPLVFPCATGDANYIGAAVETIEGMRLVKEKLPYVKTVLGISNVSFGLPAAAREVVNSVFLYYCDQGGAGSGHRQRGEAGAVRVDSGRGAAPGGEPALQHAAGGRRGRIAAHRARGLARADRRAEGRHQPVAYRRRHRSISGKTGKRVKQRAEDLPLDQRLANYIIEGTKDGLIADLDRKTGRRRSAAGYRQRAADGRDVGSRAALQQQ